MQIFHSYRRIQNANASTLSTWAIPLVAVWAIAKSSFFVGLYGIRGAIYMYRYYYVLHTLRQPYAWHETGSHSIHALPHGLYNHSLPHGLYNHSLPHGLYNHSLIGAFAILRKASSCPSVRPQRIARLPLKVFSCNLIFKDFWKICRENSSFTKIW